MQIYGSVLRDFPIGLVSYSDPCLVALEMFFFGLRLCNPSQKKQKS